MSDDEDQKDLTTADEQQQDPKQVQRKKTGRASGKSSGGGGKTESRKTPAEAQPASDEDQRKTRDGKPIRKTASGFTVVG